MPTTLGSRPRVIYRPGKAIGIGHLLSGLTDYAFLARKLDADFVATISQTVFDQGQNADDFLSEYFVYPTGALHFSYPEISEALSRASDQGKNVLVIGRGDNSGRPLQEFPTLARADFLSHQSRADQFQTNKLQAYDLIFVDSVLMGPGLSKAVGPAPPIFAFNDAMNRLALSLTQEHPYIAVHLRHGNGEGLHGRPEGRSPEFHQYVDKVADVARSLAQKERLKTICFSDNAETALRLTELTGGRALCGRYLPDRPFQKFLRNSTSQHPHGLHQMFVDLACLANAKHIVAGGSLFATAASRISSGNQLTIVPPTEPDYTSRDFIYERS